MFSRISTIFIVSIMLIVIGGVQPVTAAATSELRIRPIPLIRVGGAFLGSSTDLVVYVWYIEGANSRIIVDAGMDEAAGIAMGGWVVSSLDDGLARVGLSPEDVDIVIFTHLHPDHVGYAKRFTNARLIVQSAELEATLNEGNPSFDLVKELDFETISGDQQIDDNVQVMLTPGHSPGGQSVLFETTAGTVVITGFCTTMEHFEPTITAPPRTADPDGLIKSMQRVAEIADIIVPLHDYSFADIDAIPTEQEANKALVRRFLEEAFSQGNLDILDEIIAPDYVHYMAGVADVEGPEGNKKMISTMRADFPDLYWTIEDMFAEGDKVVTRATLHPSAQVTTTAICTMQIADGKLVEGRTSPDQLGTMQQLGVITPGRPSPENYMWSAPSEVTGDPGTPEENKAIALRAAEELWNQHNVDLVDEFFAADFISHNPVLSGMYPEVGTESMKQAITDHFTALPDFHVTVHETVAEGDKLAQRWTVTGTHKDKLMGIPPSGNQVTFTGFTINRFADGKIVEQWWVYDALGMMQQLTATPEKDYSNVFFMTLSPGLNMISLPLEPQTPYTARSFAEELSATTVIQLDESRQRFVGFTLDAPDDGFALEGGKGYIVNMPESKVVAFTGAAWRNQPPVEAAPAQSDGVWAFVVSGRLDVEQVANLFHVTVQNTRTNDVATDVVREGYFATAFADLTRNKVVEVGDQLEVTVRTDEFVSETFLYTVTPENIRQAFLPITLKNIEIPRQSLLLPNYPNPFNPETWIPYQLREPTDVVIRIYNATGQLVRTLDLGQREAGFYLGRTKAAYWDGLNVTGEKVASGIYFYQLRAGDFSSTRRMLILK
jgi:steroid delta-isomerase-like uncharacterized protein